MNSTSSSQDPRNQPTAQTPSQAPTPDLINAMLAEFFPGAGSNCHSLGQNWAMTMATPGPEAIRPGGFFSGPTQFGLADAALWYMTFVAIGRIEPMALTSELSIRYLRPSQGKNLWAKATLESAGRRNVIGTVRVWTDDNEHKPCATAQGTYVLPAPR